MTKRTYDVPAEILAKATDHGAAHDLLYTGKLAEAYLELVSVGYTWRKIRPKLVEQFGETHVPVQEATVFRWMLRYPEFGDAYEEARRISARAMEARALDMADDMTELDPDVTAQQVRGKAEALGQWRWSAERRDKNRFGNQVQVGNAIAITIETGLNLGQEGAITADATSVYELANKVAEDADVVDEGIDSAGEAPEPVARKMPARAKSAGNRPKRHKTARGIAVTMAAREATKAKREAKARVAAIKKDNESGE